jgi:hypothetical protein
MDAVVTTLRTVSLFADLPREVLARLVSEFDELDVAAGQGRQRVLLPQQSPTHLTLYYGTEERAFSHGQVRPFAWLYAAAVLAGFLLSLPYWRARGLVTG